MSPGVASIFKVCLTASYDMKQRFWKEAKRTSGGFRLVQFKEIIPSDKRVVEVSYREVKYVFRQRALCSGLEAI